MIWVLTTPQGGGVAMIPCRAVDQYVIDYNEFTARRSRGRWTPERFQQEVREKRLNLDKALRDDLLIYCYECGLDRHGLVADLRDTLKRYLAGQPNQEADVMIAPDEAADKIELAETGSIHTSKRQRR